MALEGGLNHLEPDWPFGRSSLSKLGAAFGFGAFHWRQVHDLAIRPHPARARRH